MEKLPQTLVNVRVRDRGALEHAAEVHAAVERESAALEGRGRVLLRPSGTEPLVRVMVEAPTAEEARRGLRAPGRARRVRAGLTRYPFGQGPPGDQPRPTIRLDAMTTCVVTGGSGFLGSHLCETLLARGHRVICVDNLDTGSLANIEHLRGPEFVFVHQDVTEPFFVDEPVDFVFHFASPASPIDYLRLPLQTLKVGSYGTHHALGLAKLHRARFLTASTSRGLRRSAGASAAGVLLGPREPDRPARRLRRGQALRRGADDGLPPPAGRGHGDRADLQHLRPADAPARRPRDPDLHAPGAAGQADHGLRRPASRRARSVTSTIWSTGSSGSPSPGYHQPVNIGNPNEFTLLELAEAVIEVTGSRSEIVFEALPTDDPQVRQPDISLARELLGWEPTVQLRDGLQRTLAGLRRRRR